MSIECKDISIDEVHVWEIHLKDTLTFSKSRDILSFEELQRADRYKNENARQQFILSRCALRIILGRYLLIRPSDIVFRYTQHKKPYITDSKKNLHFNISHSESIAVCAVTLNYHIGVDVELLKPLDDIFCLAKNILSNAEYDYFIEIPQERRLTFFYKAWTRKESFLKAVGTGLLYPIQEIELFAPNTSISITSSSEQYGEKVKWYWNEFYIRFLERDYLGTIFVEGSIKNLRFYKF